MSKDQKTFLKEFSKGFVKGFATVVAVEMVVAIGLSVIIDTAKKHKIL